LVIAPSLRCCPLVCSDGDDPEIRRELVGMINALPFADLATEPERGERVGLEQAPQPRDRRRAPGAQRQLRELGLDLVPAGDQHIVSVQECQPALLARPDPKT
jgi:hypothetical protein